MALLRTARVRVALALAWGAIATLTDVPEWCLHHLGAVAYLVAPASALVLLLAVGVGLASGRVRLLGAWRGPGKHRGGAEGFGRPGPGP